MGSGFAKKKKQAKAFQQQLDKLQVEMADKEAIGVAGNGLVTITVRGDDQVSTVRIKRECVDPEDIEGLETLIKVAFNDAIRQLRDALPPDLIPH